MQHTTHTHTTAYPSFGCSGEGLRLDGTVGIKGDLDLDRLLDLGDGDLECGEAERDDRLYCGELLRERLQHDTHNSHQNYVPI